MSKFLYPIFKLPNEYKQDLDIREIPVYIKWWLYNHYKKKHSGVLSEILTGTSFDLANTLARKFNIFEIQGNTEQTQLTGKNLLGFENVTATTYNGIQYSVNNGVITVSGTATDLVIIYLDLINPIANTQTYTKSMNVTGTYTGLQTSLRQEDGTTSAGLYSNDGANATSTLTGTATKFRIQINSGVSVNCTFKPQVEAGSTASSYEQFCGGTASPNPEFPQPIYNVTGDVNVKIQNKNLFVAQKIVDDSNNASIYITDGYIRYITGSNRIVIKPSVMKKNVGYTMKLLAKSGSSNQNSILFNAYYTDGTTEQIFSTVRRNTDEFIIIASTNANKTLDYIRSGWTDGVEAFIKIDDSMILEGVYTAQTMPPYVPHEEQNLPFTLGTQRLMLGDVLKDDGIHHIRKQIVLDGSNDENWGEQTQSGVVTKRFTLNNFITDIKISSGDNQTKVVSNMFLQGNYLRDDNFIFSVGNRNFIWVGSTQLQEMTLAQFKSFLSENPLIIEYELAEEETISYTETQATQYNAIKEAKTYNDKTYVEGSSSEIAPILKIQYYEKEQLSNEESN